MQVKCTKCSQPIALTDIFESNNAQLSHIDCKRPQALTPEERALVFVYCSGHVVAQGPACDCQIPLHATRRRHGGRKRHEHVPSVSSGTYRVCSRPSLPLRDAALGNPTQGAGGKGTGAAPPKAE